MKENSKIFGKRKKKREKNYNSQQMQNAAKFDDYEITKCGTLWLAPSAAIDS